MESYNRKKLQNIKQIFTEKTGVNPQANYSRRPVKIALLAAALTACCLTMTAFSFSLFSSLSGDDLSISAEYEGDGIVLFNVENKSDKCLNFTQIKLMLWSSGEKIAPISDEIILEGTDFAAHESGTMKADLSKAYNISALEQPLTDDSYYFVLTNNNFMFGQDWMCFIAFSEPVITPPEEKLPVSPLDADKETAARILSELHPYLDKYCSDISLRRQNTQDYLDKCRSLLSGIATVSPADAPLVINGLSPEIIFDKSVPAELQHTLSGLHRYVADDCGIPVGASENDSALVLSAYLPQRKGDTDGGAELQLLYFFTYAKKDIECPESLTFIHGQLISFEELEEYKVFDDGYYVCYDATDFFYSDLRSYVESEISRRNDVYYDEKVFERISNIYGYFRDKSVLNERFYYIDE